MNDPTSTSLGEKITNTSLQIPVPTAVDDDYAQLPFSGPISSPPQKIRRNLYRRPLAHYFAAYGAVLAFGLPAVPIVVSVVTIIIYLSNPLLANWLSLVLGFGATTVVWLAVSFLLAPLTYAKNANAGSYGTLESRLKQLEARLFTIRNEYPDERVLPEYQQVALSEAFDKLQEITEDLYETNSSLPWALGFGYVNVWRKLHRAEEALVEVEPQEMVMRGAMHDKMAISGSQISNRDELLDKLLDAVKRIDPTMLRLFKPATTPPAPGVGESPEVQELQKDVRKLQGDVRLIAQNLRLDLKVDHLTIQKTQGSDDTRTPARASKTPPDKDDKTRGRWTLREVRRALNEYRDRHFEWVIRTRNNLLGVTFVTALGTHILLCVAILALASDPHSRSIIIAAASYYLVGALAGLFARISQAVLTNIEADDYGFSLALILSRPLYSGLAGLGGVLVSSTVLSISNQSPVLTIFTPGRLDFLIVAAAFGLTPGLILGGLQNQTTKMLSALSSSKTTAVGTKTNSSAGTNGDSNGPDAGN
jgi:hypothetical protein